MNPRDRELICNSIRYRNIQIKEREDKNPVIYDENPTSIQKQIEMSVTNGRGYLSLEEALEVVNKDKTLSKISLNTAYNGGIVPINFMKKRKEDVSYDRNPCAEISLGELKESVIHFIIKPLTLVERLRGIQFSRGFEKRYPPRFYHRPDQLYSLAK